MVSGMRIPLEFCKNNSRTFGMKKDRENDERENNGVRKKRSGTGRCYGFGNYFGICSTADFGIYGLH